MEAFPQLEEMQNRIAILEAKVFNVLEPTALTGEQVQRMISSGITSVGLVVEEIFGELKFRVDELELATKKS